MPFSDGAAYDISSFLVLHGRLSIEDRWHGDGQRHRMLSYIAGGHTLYLAR